MAVLLVACAACTVKPSPSPDATATFPQPSLASSLPVTDTLPEPTSAATASPEATLLPPPDAGGVAIVYPKDGRLWLSRDGSAVQLSPNGVIYAPQFSPDGQQIAYLRQVDDFHLELWAIHIDGTNERRLVSVADMDAIGAALRQPGAVAINPLRFAWVPGGQVIAFTSQQIFQGPSPARLDDLNLVDASTGKLTFSLLAGWGGEFIFSPDGGQVAISTPTQIILANPDGSNYRAVFNYEPVNSYSESRFYASPVWAADGSYLLVAVPPVDPLAEPPLLTEIWRITLDGVSPQQINGLQAVPYFDTPVAFSPAASFLAVVNELGTPAEMRRELKLVSSDGASSQVYTAAVQLNFIAWASDSRHFFFAQGEDQAMYLGALDEPPQLLNSQPVGILAPRWVGDGRFVYIQQDGNKFHLCLGAIGSAPRLLETLSEFPRYDLYSAYP